MKQAATTAPILVFDLDGTLIDSALDLATAANRLLAEWGRAPLGPDRIRGFVGDGARRLVERCFEATGGLPAEADSLTARYVALYEEKIADATVVFDGVRETLAQLRDGGYRLAICTNKPEGATRRLLAALDLAPYFEDLVGGDSLPMRKPDPGHILGLLARMAGHPANAVMIGDSANDVFAGRNAGLKTILVTFGYCHSPIDQLPADAFTDNFAEIPAILTEFGLTGRAEATITLDSRAPAP